MNMCAGISIRYFLRPISPYGFAIKTRHRTGYEMERFLEFYKKGLAHILKVNRGGYRIAEVYTQILLTKILTPHRTRYVDMQSPAGEAWSVLVYNYDGDVYASDESRMLAEMNDRTFRLGNVHQGYPANALYWRSGAADCFKHPAIRRWRAAQTARSSRIALPTRYTTTRPRATCTGIGLRAASAPGIWRSSSNCSRSSKRMTARRCGSCGRGSPESARDRRLSNASDDYGRGTQLRHKHRRHPYDRGPAA